MAKKKKRKKIKIKRRKKKKLRSRKVKKSETKELIFKVPKKRSNNAYVDKKEYEKK